MPSDSGMDIIKFTRLMRGVESTRVAPLYVPGPLILKEIEESKPAFAGQPWADAIYADLHEAEQRWTDLCDW